MPSRRAIPEGINREHVLDAIAEFERQDELPDGFGPSTGYDLIHEGQRYPPKVIVGLAAKLATGVTLTGGNFTGGEESKCFRVLRDCGFDVIAKDPNSASMKKAAKEKASNKVRTWSAQEYSAAIATYMHMLVLELDGKPFVKKHLNTKLLEQLDDRTGPSAEMRFQNISSALQRMRLPWVDGYKPLPNHAMALLDGLDEFFRQSPDVLARLQHAKDKLGHATLTEASPPKSKPAKPATKKKRTGRKTDYAELEEKARTLGLQGERLVFEQERKRIKESAPQYLDRVRWVSQDEGDGLGYDIESCDADGSLIYLEVKTTNGPASTPFFVSTNEVAVSDEQPNRYQIVRVFEFATAPKFYRLKGSLTALVSDGEVSLEATQFRVRTIS